MASDGVKKTSDAAAAHDAVRRRKHDWIAPEDRDSSQDGLFRVGTLVYTKAGLAALFGWLLWGDFCFQLFEYMGGPNSLTLYLQTNYRVNNKQINLVFMIIPQLVGVLVGPILSFKSDRHRGRMGRRLPYILWTMPFLCLFTAAIGYADEIVVLFKSQIGAEAMIAPVTAALVAIAFLVIGFTFFNEFVNTVFWYLFRDVVPMPVMGRFLGLFRMVASAAGFLFKYLIGPNQLKHMRDIHVGAAVIYFVGFSLLCWGVKEGDYPPVTDVTERSTLADQVKLYFRECCSQRIFILVYVLSFWFALARSAVGDEVFGFHISQHVAQADVHARAALAMTPSGQVLLSAGEDGRAQLWDGSCFQRLKQPFWDRVRRGTIAGGRTLDAKCPALTSAALSPDGRWAIAGGADGAIRIWDASSGARGMILAGDSGPVLALAVSEDGGLLASGSAGGEVCLRDLKSGVRKWSIAAHQGPVRCVAFSSAGGRIASGGLDRQIHLYDVSPSAQVTVIRTPGPVYALTFMPSLAEADALPPRRVSPMAAPFHWALSCCQNVFSNESLYDCPAQQRSRIVREDGWVVSGGQEHNSDALNAMLRIWDAGTGQAVMALKGHKEAITCVDYKADMHMVLSGSGDGGRNGSLRLWDPLDRSRTSNDDAVRMYSGYTMAVAALAAPAAGKLIVNSDSAGVMHMWDMDAGISLLKSNHMTSFFLVFAFLLNYPFGVLVDRFNPIRLTFIAALIVAPAPAYYYFCQYDYRAVALFQIIKSPMYLLIGAASMPMLMMIFPKDKYGQFASANNLIRQLTYAVFSFIIAIIMDIVTRDTLLTENFRYAHLVTLVGFVGYQVTLVAIWREWKRMRQAGNTPLQVESRSISS